MAISWCSEHHRTKLSEYLINVYPPFWRRQLDIEDAQVVAQVLENSGIPSVGFIDYQAEQGRQQHDALQSQLHDAGIFGVPTYVFDDEILFGREHLPYVEWPHRTHRPGTGHWKSLLTPQSNNNLLLINFLRTGTDNGCTVRPDTLG